MKSLEELKEFYFTNLKDSLAEMEEQRIKSKEKAKKNIVKFTPIYIVVAPVVLGIFSHIIPRESFLFAILLYFFIAYIIYIQSLYKYEEAFKDKIISPLIQSIDESMVYKKDQHISKEIFSKSNLFKKPDRMDGDDYVSGEIDGVKIEFSDLDAQERTKDSKGEITYRTFFKGLFIKSQFNKNLKGKTVVLPDTAQSTFGTIVGNWLQSKNMKRDELVKMDNIQFEKEFVVYSTDQVEARYILTPTMMERLLEYKKKINAPIYISFADDCIHVAVYNKKNHFEAKVFSSLLDYEVAKEYISNLYFAISIVEELKLNEKLWGKNS